MARAVVRASSQYLEVTTAALPAGSYTAFTVSCWYRPTSIANGTAFGIGDSNSNDYIALGMDGSGNAFVEVVGANATAGTLTNGAWAHIAGVQTSATNRVAYKDGVAGSANTSNFTPGAMDRTTVGGLVLNGSRLSFAGGDIAECAAWDSALSAGDIALLAAGRNPLIMATAPRRYWRLLGSDSPELEYMGSGESLTNSGSTAAAHPPLVQWPGPPLLVTAPVGA